MGQYVDAATIRAARGNVIACAVALSLLLVASVWAPQLVFWSRQQGLDERLLLALFIGTPLSLGLALRDPIRNAGVFATVGLACGLLAAARVMNFLVPSTAPQTNVYTYFGGSGVVESWIGSVVLLAVGAILVMTYARLRRPHPIVVRVVVVAVALVPVVLWAYEVAARAVRSGG